MKITNKTKIEDCKGFPPLFIPSENLALMIITLAFRKIFVFLFYIPYYEDYNQSNRWSIILLLSKYHFQNKFQLSPGTPLSWPARGLSCSSWCSGCCAWPPPCPRCLACVPWPPTTWRARPPACPASPSPRSTPWCTSWPVWSFQYLSWLAGI